MFTSFRTFLTRFLNKSRTINNEPLNKVSLIVIILIDIFILANVFNGLEDISQWHLSPDQTYPCYHEWRNYRIQTTANKNFEMLRAGIPTEGIKYPSLKETYQQVEKGHLGKVDKICLTYAQQRDKINDSENRKIIQQIDQTSLKISDLERENNTILSQYDSTLLEKIAGQKKEKSINQVSAEKAKQKLAKNNLEITTLHQEIQGFKRKLFVRPVNTKFINFLNQNDPFGVVEQSYKKAVFWYPSVRIFFQALFLVPLIVITFWINNLAQAKGYGLVALIGWHLQVIFFIPLVLKIFEFLQIGFIFQLVFDFVKVVCGGLLFLISYLYILLIPLVGFGIIKFFQTIVFNPKGQISNRFQKSRCVKCAKKIRPQDSYCPHCGYYQYIECSNCHTLTYNHLPHCKVCGASQESSNNVQSK